MEASSDPESLASIQPPRVAITYCTQCRWMLRAAYFAQELLSTFSTSLGEVALIPSTGGIFTVDIIHRPQSSNGESDEPEPDVNSIETQRTRLWDRKVEGGFPEVKHLKQLVRNIIDPTRDLGHVDRHSSKPQTPNPRPEGLHIAPEPKPTESAAVPKKDEKILTDDSASRKETVIVTDPEAGIVKEVG